MCGKKRGRRSKGDTWRWNEWVKEEVSRKKDEHRTMCRHSTEENKRRYKGMKNKARKQFQKQEERRLKRRLLKNCPNWCID